MRGGCGFSGQGRWTPHFPLHSRLPVGVQLGPVMCKEGCSGTLGRGGEREVPTVTDCKDKCTSEMTCGYKSVSVALFAEDYVSMMLS